MKKKYEKVQENMEFADIISYGLRLAINNADRLSKDLLIKRINNKVDRLNGVTPEREVRSGGTTRTRTTKTNVPKVMAKNVEGEIVTILGKPEKDGKMILVGRRMKVTSTKGENLIGFLIKESDGSLQASEITMPIQYTNKQKAKAQ